MTAKKEGKQRIYADSIKETIKKEEGRCQQESPVVEKIREESKAFRRTTPPRRPFAPMYECLFYGHCYSCGRFGQ